MQLDRRQVGHEHQRRRTVQHRVPLGASRSRVPVVEPGEPVGSVLGHLLLPEALGGDPVGEPLEVHGATAQVRQDQRRDRRVVADQVAFGQVHAAGPGGEEHLVQVGHRHVDAVDVPRTAVAEGVERLHLGRRRRVPPDLGVRSSGWRCRRMADLLVGPSGQHRVRVVLGVPSLRCVLVGGVDHQPLLALAGAPAGPDQRHATTQLLAGQLQVQLAPRHLGHRVVALGQPVGPSVPHHDVAGAVLAVGDDPLEVQVVDRVVLDVHRQPPDTGVQRGAPGHRPAHEHAVDLEAHVVVQPSGPMALHDEPGLTRPRPADRAAVTDAAGGLGCVVEVALVPVRLEAIATAGHTVDRNCAKGRTIRSGGRCVPPWQWAEGAPPPNGSPR